MIDQKLSKTVRDRDQFKVIDDGVVCGEQTLYPLYYCISCGTELQDFGDDLEGDMVAETLEHHKERCQGFKE